MGKINLGPVRRIRVRWQDGKWTVASERRVSKMIIPNTQSLPKVEKGQEITGFWFEVADSKGKILYRRIINDPLRQQIEVPNIDGTFTNIPVSRRDITFEVLIPDDPENATLSFFGTEEHPKERKAILRKMAQLDLRVDYRRKRKSGE